MEEIAQYDEFAENFSVVQEESNQASREALYKNLPESFAGMKVLDLGCGDGSDLLHAEKLGATCYGIDARGGA